MVSPLTTRWWSRVVAFRNMRITTRTIYLVEIRNHPNHPEPPAVTHLEPPVPLDLVLM